MRGAGRGGGFVALPEDGLDVAQGLRGSQNTTLWFELDLTAHECVRGGELVKRASYTAECSDGPR